MTSYVLITPEIEYPEPRARHIGKTFIAAAVVEKLRADHKVVLHIDETPVDIDIDTRKVNAEILKDALIRGRDYDYIVIAGLTKDVENAFRILRTKYYPEAVKTIKLQAL